MGRATPSVRPSGRWKVQGRHLLEKRGLGEGLFDEINAHLASRGHRLRTGTIVDASIIDAPSSTKNRRRALDPEMHQTRKGKQWYFG